MVTYSSFVVVAIYMAMTLLISYIVNKRNRSQGDFSTGGRQFGWFTAGVSILATYISAMTFIGMPAWVFHSGMEVMAIHLNYPIVIFFAITFFVPVFYKLKLTSIYEYLELRFGLYARTINAIVFLIIQCISAGVILYAVALVLVQVVPISLSQAIIYISLFTAVYTYSGGIATVIWTDMLQSSILVIGTLAIFISLIMQVHSGIDLPPHKLNIINTHFDLKTDTTIWAGLIAVSFLNLSVYGSNQLIIQRTLATKDVETAQKSMLLCGYGSFFIYLLFAIIGLLLSVFYHGQPFANSNEVILDFVFNHTNPITIGLIIAALSSAAMSTLDSTYNSMATVATFDLYKRLWRPNEPSNHYDSVARKMSLLAAVLVVIPALLAISNESVLKTIASLTAIFVGIRLGSFVLGLFFNKANEFGVIVGSVFSIIAVAITRYIGIAWPWFAPIGTLVFLFFGVISSYFYGSISPVQTQFVVSQKSLFSKPKISHYGLLFFAFISTIACYWFPHFFS
ncbi:sodium/solute symporter [Vibrio sp. S11_S32]|uniref:sodium:solute symporter family transporter n=1 Tax=Vibrio sp. S11_S32 TaxID=2720225 RepID=UPI001680728D|nr:sodium/solute symporter [Vibrio sp. S11_S32]MBD1577487.1 sodium/solute symporter [Vibrio sp. S11_S32]